LRRLPTFRIIRADEVNKVVFNKNTCAADLRARQPTLLDPLSDLFAMHVQEFTGLHEIECLHGGR
jgi:hypothetical protein